MVIWNTIRELLQEAQVGLLYGVMRIHQPLVLGTLSLDNVLLPTEFALDQNYPNPFKPITNLKYDLPEDSYLDIAVYDILGNLVFYLVNKNQSSGSKSVQWDAKNNQGEPVSAGVYLYKIQAGDFSQTKKMILLK